MNALNRENLIKMGLLGVIVLLLAVLFHWLGNTFQNVPTRSVFVWMAVRWQDRASFGADYSHGWLIPFVSLGALWFRRNELLAAPKSTARRAWLFVAAALLLHWVGARIQQPRVSLFSLILLLWSIPLYLYGWPFARQLIFPCSYLIFCIPLNFMSAFAFPLRMFAAKTATAFLNGVGIAAARSGSAIYSAAGGGFSFDIADACSGLRSLLAMMALGAAYAVFTQPTALKKWALFLLSIPIAVLSNVVRIVTIGIVAQIFGQQRALTVYHDYSGYLLFSAATLMVIGAGRLLQAGAKHIPPPGNVPS